MKENKDFKKPLVSVIITTFNREDLLVESIQSVLQQTYRPIECIVVDDGSSDNTKSTIENLLNSVDEGFALRYIYQDNSGAQVARNTGTAAASGAFIQYLDSDDILYKEKLSTQVEYLNNHSNCDAVFGDWEVGTVDNCSVKKGYVGPNLINQILTLEGCIPIFSLLYNRQILEKTNGWDIQIKRCQEIDFQLTGLINGAKFDYDPFNTGLYRHHEGDRIISTVNAENFVGFYKKWELILTSLNQFDQTTKDKIARWYMYFAALLRKGKSNNISLLVSEAVRLCPKLAFYNSAKMRFLRLFLGKKISIAIWLYSYKKLKY